MGLRDISPSPWAATGTARVGLDLLLTALGFEEVPLDTWGSNYSATSVQNLNLVNGVNTISVPDTTNCRFALIVAPPGNAQTWTVKGVAGDTGIPQNPNGFCLTSFAATTPASIVIFTGGAIAGFRIFWF